MASTTIKDLLVGLGVTIKPGTIDALDEFDKRIAKAVKSFAALGKSVQPIRNNAAAIRTLTLALKGLNKELGDMAANSGALNSLNKIRPGKTATSSVAAPNVAGASSAPATTSQSAAQTAEQRRQAKALEQHRRNLERIGASSSAVDKAAYAFEREKKAILEAEAATGDHAAAQRAMAAAQAKYDSALDAQIDRELKAEERRQRIIAQKDAHEERRRKRETQAARAEAAHDNRRNRRLEMHRNNLERIGGSASAVDKATAAFEREKRAIHEATLETGDHEAAARAYAAAQRKYNKALADDALRQKKIKDKEQKDNYEQSRQGVDKFIASLNPAIAAMEMAIDVAVKLSTAIAAVGVAFAANSIQVAKDGIQVERLAKTYGITNESYQKFRYTFSLFGVDQRDVNDLFGQYSQKVMEANNGSKMAVMLFKKLGLNAKELVKMPIDEQIYKLSDALNTIENDTIRTAVLGALAGEDLAKKAGPGFIEGAQALREYGEQAKRLGFILSDADVKLSAKFTKSVARLTTVLEGLRRRIGIELMPRLEQMSEAILAWYDANGEIIKQDIADFMKHVADAFTQVGNAVVFLRRIWGGWEGFKEFIKDVDKFLDSDLVRFFQKLTMATQVFLYYLIAVSLAWQDFYVWMNGGKSIIGELINKYAETDSVLGGLVRVFLGLTHVLSAGYNLMLEWAGIIWDELLPVRNIVKEILGMFLRFFGLDDAGLLNFLDGLQGGLDGIAYVLEKIALLMGYKPEMMSGVDVNKPVNIPGGSSFYDPGRLFNPQKIFPFSVPNIPNSMGGAGTRNEIGSVTFEGAIISGVGLSKDELADVLEQHQQEQARFAQTTLFNSPV